MAAGGSRPVDVLLDLGAHPVIGHRGAAGHAPENTLASFRLAVEHGAEALEADVHLSADGVPVVIHDATLDRTTDRSGPVAARPLDELRGADAGARWTADGGRTFPFRGRDVRIPTLEELLRAFPGMPFVLEIKAVSAQHAARRVILDAEAADRCVIAADAPAALEAFREPPLVRGASRDDIGRLRFPWLFGRPRHPLLYRALFVPDRYYGVPVATRAFVAAARAQGCPVHVWTVDDPATARRLWSLGAAGIITNVPREIRAARAGLG